MTVNSLCGKKKSSTLIILFIHSLSQLRHNPHITLSKLMKHGVDDALHDRNSHNLELDLFAADGAGVRVALPGRQTNIAEVMVAGCFDAGLAIHAETAPFA